MLKNFLFIGLGGAVGAMLRYGMTVLSLCLHWPYGMSTFIVNVLGSFAMGLLVSGCEQGSLLMMATVGLCGGFTTFSTFSLQSVGLIQEGKWAQAALYIAGTLAFCLLMTWLGCIEGTKMTLSR